MRIALFLAEYAMSIDRAWNAGVPTLRGMVAFIRQSGLWCNARDTDVRLMYGWNAVTPSYCVLLQNLWRFMWCKTHRVVMNIFMIAKGVILETAQDDFSSYPVIFRLPASPMGL